MSEEGNKRKTALLRLKVITALLAFLGAGLLLCAGLAVKFDDDNSFGFPYYIGGFVVGAPASLAALVSIGMLLQVVGKDADDSAMKEIAPFMSCQYSTTVLLFPACFIGCIFTGIGGFSGEEEDRPKGTNKYLAVLILVGCIITFLVVIVSMSTVRKYGKYFGVIINKRGTRNVVTNSSREVESSGTTVNVRTNMNVFTTDVQNQHMSQLERQNKLLQQQVNLQQQMLNQQQQQQQQQQDQFAGGLYPPPPPPRYYDSDPAYPPTAPPTALPTAPPPPYSK